MSSWPERELVPYEASSFTAARALVLAPHADDEVFGCGAALAQLRAGGAEITVAVLTDGASDEADPGKRASIAAERAAESRAALDALGGGELLLGDLPDRGLLERRAELSAAIARLVRDRRPDLVFVPSPSEIHPDHRGVAEAFLEAAAGELAPFLATATIAFYEVSQPIRPNFLLDATPYAAAKDHAMASFPSQTGGRDYPRFMRGLNAYRALTLGPHIVAAEAFYVISGPALAAHDAVQREAFRRALGPAPTPHARA
jgi:LmbE family N-acetylglucosaminyl deacetylase